MQFTKFPSQILLITTIITIILPLCQSATIKQLNQSCLCDISDNCDFQCCCDTQCTDLQKSLLGLYDKCGDDGYGIPLCSNVNIIDVNVDDLYSGLKTIYTVIKRLFCVQRVNIVNPTTYYNKVSSDSVITDAIGRINSSISTASLIPNKYASLSQSTIAGIFFRSQLGICTVSNSIYGNISTNGMQECRAYLNPTTISNNQILSIAKIKANFPKIKVFSMSDSSGSGPDVNSPTISTSCSVSSCQNVVKLLKLFINPTNNQVNQALSYVVIGSLGSISLNGYIVTRYQYNYLNQDGTFANVSNIGYKIGSPLQLLKSSTNGGSTIYLKIANPINLAFRNANGACRTSPSQSADQSLIQLKLGRNQFHTCVGDLSNIYSNLKNSFNMIGIIGSSNTVLADYVTITWPTLAATADSSNVVLKIYYVKVGASTNPQYYILQAKAELINNTEKYKTLFIQYQQVVGTTSMFIPPPPVVDAYLPNDFLYPFYVVQ